METIECACGCGSLIPAKDKKGRPRRYVNHHGNRGRKRTQEQIAQRTATRLSRGNGFYTRKGWRQPSRATPAIERFERSYEIDSDGCWIWNRRVLATGYASLTVYGVGSVLGHRWSYEHFVGPIPDGYVIDHLCHTRACRYINRECKHRRCVNPAHLAAVTHRENVLRGNHPSILIHETGSCGRGHDPSEYRYRKDFPGRMHYCLACGRENRAAKRATMAAWNAGYVSVSFDDE